MPLWGAHPHDTEGVDDPEAKPKFLTTEEKYDVYATDRGWTAPAGGNPNGEREVLVAIGGLADATKLAAPNISSINWYKLLGGPPWGDPGTPTFTNTAGGQMGISVNFNEVVIVDNALGGNPKIVVTNANPIGTDLDFEYLDGSGTNRLIFASEDFEGGGENPIATDALSIGADVLVGNLNSATIKDAGGTDAILTNPAQYGVDAGTVTVG